MGIDYALLFGQLCWAVEAYLAGEITLDRFQSMYAGVNADHQLQLEQLGIATTWPHFGVSPSAAPADASQP